MSALLPIGALLPEDALAQYKPGTVPNFIPPGFPGSGVTTFFGKSPSSAILSSLPTARIVTGILGFLLIAAAIFTHPTVVNVTKRAATVAGEAAAAA